MRYEISYSDDSHVVWGVAFLGGVNIILNGWEREQSHKKLTLTCASQGDLDAALLSPAVRSSIAKVRLPHWGAGQDVA